ncbi:MAG: GNAT family N-acetyltransferase [Nostocaceae cyanobacterium]|nr:GNAT family N-acetyltransferase [Nostocaceae cyanobacterium]
MNQKDVQLPPGCILRQAIAVDIWSIRWLVLKAKLDPTQIRWQQFWVIECERKVVACGQLRNFADVQELGSLVVTAAWRDRGLGSLLTQHLIEEASKPLYLECLGKKLVEFYTRLGFVTVAFEELPPSIKSKFGMSNLGKRLVGVPVTFMEFPGVNKDIANTTQI